MSCKRKTEQGFTLIETLVALSLLSMVTAGVYTMMISSIKSTETSRAVVRQSEEARLGFNRMIRDTREATVLDSCNGAPFASCYVVRIDFNNDGVISNPNARGDYEDLSYMFSEAARVITLNGETLIGGVYEVPGKPIFEFQSNALEYDSNGNGVTTAAELDASGVASVGNGNGILDGPELSHITTVAYAFRVQQSEEACATSATPADPCETFYAAAQLRNRR